MAVKAKPDGYHTITPYLIVRGAAAALEYYKAAFGAEEMVRMSGPGGTIGHAEIRIGDSVVMLADESPNGEWRSPQALGGSPVGLAVYVEDVDSRFNQAIAAGGKVIKPLANQFYGDRSGTLLDPFGHQWTLATHVEDVSPEEMRRRMDAMMKQGGCG